MPGGGTDTGTDANTEREDDALMNAAIALAARGAGRTRPNPSVGCLLVKEGRLVARARTADSGRPHAEAQALAIALDAARGATAYVTLEPCSHQGQTPPCADALIEAGIARCVIGISDPDKRVSGQGIAALKQAGIEVTTGVRAHAVAAGLSGYLTHRRLGRPEIILKLATTLDGKIATQTGESRWITGPTARRKVHALRARADAVLIGIGTALDDDPLLDVRDMGDLPQPVRVVLDSRLRLPLTSRLVQSAARTPVWVIHGAGAEASHRAALEQAGVRLLEVPTGQSGQTDIAAALACLGDAGLTSILCEGGAGVAAALLKAGCADRLALFSAGKVIGAEGISAVGALGLDTLKNAPSFDLLRTEVAGPDTLSLWQSRAARALIEEAARSPI